MRLGSAPGFSFVFFFLLFYEKKIRVGPFKSHLHYYFLSEIVVFLQKRGEKLLFDFWGDKW